MKWAKFGCVLLVIAAILAIEFRVPRLDIRPMHTDEAVHADKFRMLLEEGEYEYDPFEYHGPTLNYLTLVPALLDGAGTYVQVEEFHLRIVPAVFGVLLILLLLVLADGLGWLAAGLAALFTAVSPVMVFYSRYYIMEILLVVFTFGVIVSGYRYIRTHRLIWAILAGAFLGLMQATKETAVIAYGAMVAGLLVVAIIRLRKGYAVGEQLRAIRWPHMGAGAAAAILVGVLFFSSFFTHPEGIVDAFRTYTVYFNRAGGNPVHVHPWHYYLDHLAWYQYRDEANGIFGPVYSEALILGLAAVGLGVAVAGRGLRTADAMLLRFLAVYTVAMIVVYSIIPYKTPWCLLGFYHGMILLAGVGAAAMLRIRWRPVAAIVGVAVIVGLAHLGWQTYTSSFRFYSDSRNPWVYAHTGRDVFEMVRRVNDMAAAADDPGEMTIQVLVPGADYWPLPWYLRGYNVGYDTMVQLHEEPASVILYHPSLREALFTKLFELRPPGQREMYMDLFWPDGPLHLRPGLPILGAVRHSLWEKDYYRQPEESEMERPEPSTPEATDTTEPQEPDATERP